MNSAAGSLIEGSQHVPVEGACGLHRPGSHFIHVCSTWRQSHVSEQVLLSRPPHSVCFFSRPCTMSADLEFPGEVLPNALNCVFDLISACTEKPWGHVTSITQRSAGRCV
jgi:hypothetical protein